MFEMVGNILKNLGSKPATRRYPYEKREPFKGTRGSIDINMDACIFCGLCQRKCPSNAIKVNKAEASWEIDPFKCIICGVCTESCPKKCIFTEENYKTVSVSKDKIKHIQQSKQMKAEA